ncbi:MAG: phosphatidate cytidylyltransferase, partial [Candidatus Pacebacteria bacterium]|nr:phosphatidate cytidylyltransferase [Candidatus Paceibacterota bacterium]
MKPFKKLSLTNLQKRIISAVVILLIFALVLYLGKPWLGLFICLVIILGMIEWVRMVKNRPLSIVAQLAFILLGGIVLYAALMSLYWLVVMLPDVGGPNGFSSSGLAVILLLVSLVVASDTAAFFVGRRLGGPKLAPRLSP